MIRYRWALLAVRAVALCVMVWVIVAGWRPAVDFMGRHEVRIEIRPLTRPPELPRWT